MSKDPAVLNASRREPEQLDFDSLWARAPTSKPARVYLEVVNTPKTRAGCEDEGLCLALRCRHNTTLEVTSRGGIRLNAAGYSELGRYLTPRRRLDDKLTGFEANDLFDERVVSHLAADGMDGNCSLDSVRSAPDGMTLDEIAVELGERSRQRVEQVEKRALAKLRRECDRQGIKIQDFIESWRYGVG